MPRAFLIKKKRNHGLSSSSSSGAKKAKWHLGLTSSHLELDLSNKKERSYDSGSESVCSSETSSRMPSPSASPNPPLVPATAPAYMGRPTTALGDLYGRGSVLEPLNLNAVTAASALPWMKPFLAPYLPFNFPYPYPSNPYSEAAYPHHFLPPSSSVSPSSHRVLHPQQGYSVHPVPKGTLYPSRSEPPSPSCPCPLSPYTPPRDGVPASKTDKLTVPTSDEHAESSDSSATADSALNMSVTPGYWTESERCASNGSVQSDNKDFDDHQLVIREESPKPVSNRRRPPEGGPRYQCPNCNKSYSTYSGLSKHQQFHCSTTNKRSFSCKYCDKVYMSLGSLKMHIRCHSLPCLCPMCPKRFSRPWLLQGHIRTHTGEKPFICPNCNRAFADRSNLRAHLQTHSDVKKYSCKACGKTFSRMSLLLKHGDGGACTANAALAQSQDRLGP